MNTLGHYIDGAAVAGTSGRYGDVFDPARGIATARLALASPDEVDLAVAAAKRAFPGWAATPPPRRAAVMFRFRELLLRDAARLSAIITAEHGKTLDDARGELQRGIEVVEFACGIRATQGRVDRRSRARHRQLFDAPAPGRLRRHHAVQFSRDGADVDVSRRTGLRQHVRSQAPEKDPSLGFELAALLSEAGLPPGVFNVLSGDRDAVEALLRIRMSRPSVSSARRPSPNPCTARERPRANAFRPWVARRIIWSSCPTPTSRDARRDHRRGLWLRGRTLHGHLGRRRRRPRRVCRYACRATGRTRARLEDRPGNGARRRDGAARNGRTPRRVKGYIDLGVSEGATLVVDGRDYRDAASPEGSSLAAAFSTA